MRLNENIKAGDKIKTENGMYGILISIGEHTSWIESRYHGKFEFINKIISVDNE